MSRHVRLLALLLTLATAGCATRTVHLAPGVTYTLQPPAGADRQCDVVQQVQATTGTQTFTLWAQLQLTPAQLVLAGLTTTGTRVFLLTDDGQRLRYEPRDGFRLPLDPRLMLAAMQLACWPADHVRQGLRGATLTCAADPAGELRTLCRGKEELLRIHVPPDPWQGTLRYDDPRHQFSLEVSGQPVTTPDRP